MTGVIWGGFTLLVYRHLDTPHQNRPAETASQYVFSFSFGKGRPQVIPGTPGYLELPIYLPNFSKYLFLCGSALRVVYHQSSIIYNLITVDLQWLEHIWNHENMLETGVVRANEG